MNHLAEAAVAVIEAQGYSREHAEKMAQLWYPDQKTKVQLARERNLVTARAALAAKRLNVTSKSQMRRINAMAEPIPYAEPGTVMIAGFTRTLKNGTTVHVKPHTRPARIMSPEGRQAIAENTRQQWAAAKAAGLNHLVKAGAV